MYICRWDLKIALALFCVLSCVYALTAGAHIDSTDGETVYLVAESLVERGTFAQQETEQVGDAPRTLSQAPNGKLYAVTGPLQSLLAIPFYMVGRWVARAFPPPFYTYFTRFFVAFFNSPVSAATAACLYLFSVDLGYRRRTSLFVTLTYALGTIAWPYAHTFFAESLHTFWLVLAAWAIYRYARTDQWPWMSLSGTALALGTATKYVMAVAGPAFLLYLIWHFIQQHRGKERWQWTKRTFIAGALPFLIFIGILMLFNYARFGNILETGYTSGDTNGPMSNWGAKMPLFVGLYGFFLSSGKGLFFFAPPTLLSLWGWRALAQRRRHESLLFLVLIGSYPLFYSIITRWFGGANWGPRYIVCITPFLILPLGAFLERQDLALWWRVASATILFVIGFWVQISTVFVNYNTYLFSDTEFNQQLFYPQHSPLLAQWRLWPRQYKAWQAYDHSARTSKAQFALIQGDWHNIEVPDMAPFGRWMGAHVQLRTYATPTESLSLHIQYSRPHLADEERAPWQGLHLVYDGVVVSSERTLIAENEKESQWLEIVTIPAHQTHIIPGTLEITAPTWTPSQFNDERKLSVFVSSIKIISDQTPLSVQSFHLPAPMPVSTAYAWRWKTMKWFYDPINARPFDIWPWYVWCSGIPISQARTLISVLGVLLGTGFLASSAWLVNMVKEQFRL